MREELKKFGILILTFSLIIGLCSGIEVQADSDKLPVFTNQPVFSEYNPNTDKFEGNPTGTGSYSVTEYVWLDYEECGHDNGYDMTDVKKVVISSDNSTDIETDFQIYPVINVIKISSRYNDNLVAAYKSNSMKLRIVFNDDNFIESDVLINNENYLKDQLNPKSDGTFGTLITALDYSEYLKTHSLKSLDDSLPKFYDEDNNRMYVSVDELQGGLSIPLSTRKVMLRDNETGDLTTIYSKGGVNFSNDFRYTLGYYNSKAPSNYDFNFYDTVDKAQLPLLMNKYVSSNFTIPYDGCDLISDGNYLVGQSFASLSWEELYNQCSTGEGVIGQIYKYNNTSCYYLSREDTSQDDYSEAPASIKDGSYVTNINLEEINSFLVAHPNFKYKLEFKTNLFRDTNKLDSSDVDSYLADNPDYLKCVPNLSLRFVPSNYKIVDLLKSNKDKLIGNKCSVGELDDSSSDSCLYNAIGLTDVYYNSLVNYSVNQNGLPVGITSNDLQSLYKLYMFMVNENDVIMRVGIDSSSIDELKSKFTEEELNSVTVDKSGSTVMKDFTDYYMYINLKSITGETATKFLDNYGLYESLVIYKNDPDSSSNSINNFLKEVGDSYGMYSVYYDKIDNSYRQWDEKLITSSNVDEIINGKLGACINITNDVGLDVSDVYPSNCINNFKVYLNPNIKDNGGFPDYDKVVSFDELKQSEEYSTWLDYFYNIYPQFKDYNATKCDDTEEYGKFVNGKFIFNDKFFETFDLGKSYSLVVQDLTTDGGFHTLDDNKKNVRFSSFSLDLYDNVMNQKLSSSLNFNKWEELGNYDVRGFYYTFMDFYEWDYADIVPASAPSEPRSLNSSLDGSHIEVSWNSPANEGLGQNSDGTAKTDDVIKVDNYKVSVYKVDDSARSSTLVKEDIVNSTRLNTDIPVSDKGTYRVLISASNLIGEGSQATLLINNENKPKPNPDPDPNPVNPDPEPTLELASPSIITTSSDVSSITMDWDYKGELKPEGYKVAIKEVGTDSELDWNTVSNETFSKTFTNLKSNTEYEVYVKAYKGSDESAYDFRVVTTKEELIEPTPSDDPEPTPSEEPTPSDDPEPTPSEEPTPSDDPEPTPSEEPTPSDDPEPTPSEDKLPKPIITDVKTSKTTLDVKWEYNYSKEPNYFEVGISDEVTKLPTKWDTVNKDSREHEFTDLKEGTKYYVFVRAVFDEGITDDDSEGKTISTDVIDLTNHTSEGSNFTRTGDESNGRLIIKVLIGSLYVMVGVIMFRLKNRKKQVR